jgi:eight-cysteine-cluster-containing protein
MHLALALALLACNAHHDAPLPAESAAPTATANAGIAEVQAAPPPPAGPPALPLPVDSPPPQALYDQCRTRLEGREVDGECAVDADCGRAGCSQEVCVPAAKKADVITTCEILPCFGAVEDCGCHEGRCTWKVRATLDPPVPRLPIKVSE